MVPMSIPHRPTLSVYRTVQLLWLGASLVLTSSAFKSSIQAPFQATDHAKVLPGLEAKRLFHEVVGSERSGLHQRSVDESELSTPEECVRDPGYRPQGPLDKAMASPPYLDGSANLNIWKEMKDLHLPRADKEKLLAEQWAFWEALRFNDNPVRELSGYTAKMDDICAQAWLEGFETGEKWLIPGDDTFDWRDGYRAGFLGQKKPTMTRPKFSNMGYEEGVRSRKQFHGTEKEARAWPDCFTQGVRYKWHMDPGEVEGTRRGYLNGLAVGACTRRSKLKVSPLSTA